MQFDPVTQGERPSSQKPVLHYAPETQKSPAPSQAEASHPSLSLVVLPTWILNFTSSGFNNMLILTTSITQLSYTSIV